MSQKWGLRFFYLIVFLCFLSFGKNKDFEGYWLTLNELAVNNLSLNDLPYKIDHAVLGDYFQAPVTSLWLWSWTLLPLKFAKFFYSLINALALVFGVRWLFLKLLNLSGDKIIFTTLLFTHAISDIFVSGNLNFIMNLSLVFGAFVLFYQVPTVFSYLSWIVAISVKPLAAIVFGYYLKLKSISQIFVLGISFVAVSVLAPILAGLSFYETMALYQRWLLSLRNYSDAANPLGSAFQTPTALIYKWSFLLFESKTVSTLLTQLVGLVILAYGYLRFQPKSLVSVLGYLTLLYWAFSLNWANTFLIVLPWFAFVVKEISLSKKHWVILGIYIATAQMFWPKAVWENFALWGIPGLAQIGVVLSVYLTVGMGISKNESAAFGK
jgi:hypothetical protein